MTYASILQRISLLALILSLFFVSATLAFAATDNASSNESFSQGLQKNGAVVAPARSDPSAALGVADGSFVSLGYGGELVVGFAQNMSGNLLLTVQEVTGGVYPLETADVYVSTNPAGPWTFVGEATNEEGDGDGASELRVEECYQYVRVVDTTDSSLHNDTSDGFDVDSFTADYDETCPEPKPQKPTSVHISLHGDAMVMNHVETKADTGDNSADGSYAGDGGNGGDIENEYGEQDVEGATTGNGGTGGNSGFGGAVQTGDATAESTVGNDVNSATVTVDNCGCDATSSLNRIRVHLRDSAFLMNSIRTKADTGDNYADGSYAGSGGNGGDIENEGGDGDDNADQEVDDATTGSGGNGGTSSDGGSVLTGAATSRTNLVNLVNSRLVRVRG